jgi:hypothetical protein
VCGRLRYRRATPTANPILSPSCGRAEPKPVACRGVRDDAPKAETWPRLHGGAFLLPISEDCMVQSASHAPGKSINPSYFLATFTPLKSFASIAFCTTPVCNQRAYRRRRSPVGRAGSEAGRGRHEDEMIVPEARFPFGAGKCPLRSGQTRQR